MLKWDFTRLSAKSCIYYCKSPTSTVIAAVHVDNFLSTANKWEENEVFKWQMQQVWKISDLGTIWHLAGIAIEWDQLNKLVMLSQTSLINRTISQFGQTDVNPISTPIDSGLKLQCIDRSELAKEDLSSIARIPYWSLVSCLLYLAIGTWPDIAYAVQQLSQLLDCYSFLHWHATIHIVRYLNLRVLRTSNCTLVVTMTLIDLATQTQIGQTAQIPIEVFEDILYLGIGCHFLDSEEAKNCCCLILWSWVCCCLWGIQGSHMTAYALFAFTAWLES